LDQVQRETNGQGANT